jgi:hypothetical protein
LRTTQTLLDRALGKSRSPADVAAIQNEVALSNAREELERKLEAMKQRRADGLQLRRGINIADVAKAAIDSGAFADKLDEETVVRLLSDLLDRGLIELPGADESRRNILNGLYEAGVIRPGPAFAGEREPATEETVGPED